jgi:hypothetical protein
MKQFNNSLMALDEVPHLGQSHCAESHASITEAAIRQNLLITLNVI